MFRLRPALLTGCFLATGLFSLSDLSVSAQSTTNLRIMPLGDSITAGYKSSTGNGYRGPLATALAGQVGFVDFVGSQNDGTMADPDNEGHSGYRIDQIAALTNANLSTYKPNMVTLLAGINDLGQGYEVSTAPDRLASLIDQIFSAEPDVTLLVSQLIVNANANEEAEVKTFNSALPGIVSSRASSGKHIYLVDMSAITTADLSDGLHPNDTGYQLMANAWDSAIKTVIGDGWVHDPIAGSATRPTGSFYSGLSGECLDGGNLAQGDAATIWACNGGTHQQFNYNNGNIIINNLCLDIHGGGTANKTPVDLWPCNGGTNQVWTITNGTLVNPASGLCLDDPGSSLTNGTQLEIFTCNGGANQQWQAPAQGPVISGVSGECLDDFGGSATSGTKVDIYGCNNTPAQQWAVYNHTVKFDGQCLHVVGDATANGSLVEIQACNGKSSQEWTPLNGTLVNGGSGRCLDDPGSTTVGGTQLEIFDCNGGSNQKWALPPM